MVCLLSVSYLTKLRAMYIINTAFFLLRHGELFYCLSTSLDLSKIFVVKMHREYGKATLVGNEHMDPNHDDLHLLVLLTVLLYSWVSQMNL